MADISQCLTERGYQTLNVPEAATLLFKGGADIVNTKMDPLSGARF